MRVLADSTKRTVADNLPSMTDACGGNFGPTNVAFIGSTLNVLYVLFEMGGCLHAMPEDYPAILRVNADVSMSSVINLNARLAAHPPHFLKDTNPATTDQEPGGVLHSMIAVGDFLYGVETKRDPLQSAHGRSWGRAISRIRAMSGRRVVPIIAPRVVADAKDGA